MEPVFFNWLTLFTTRLTSFSMNFLWLLNAKGQSAELARHLTFDNAFLHDFNEGGFDIDVNLGLLIDTHIP